MKTVGYELFIFGIDLEACSSSLKILWVREKKGSLINNLMCYSPKILGCTDYSSKAYSL